MTVGTLTDRLTRYFVRRLKRRARHELFVRAVDLGLLDQHTQVIAGKDVSSWMPSAELVSAFAAGDVNGLRKRLAGKRSLVDIEGEEPWASETVRSTKRTAGASRSQGGVTPRGRGASAVEPVSSPSDRRDALRLLASLAEPPSVADIATALLIARSIGETLGDPGDFFELLHRRNAFVFFKIPVRQLERSVGHLMAAGVLLPCECALKDGAGHVSLSGEYRDTPDDTRFRVTTFSGLDIVNTDADKIARAFGKAAADFGTPILVVDETRSVPPVRISESADHVFEHEGVDRAVIVELLQLCLGIAPSRSIKQLETKGFVPRCLGLDDLALAVRPGRSLEDVIHVLSVLDADNLAREEQEDNKRNHGKSKSSGTGRGGEIVIEIIRPQPDVADAGKQPGAPKVEDVVVENLSGYGQAKTWALDLKSDLQAWRAGEVAWSELSTKLLLSGPPGTGKTTFARALCNSLGVPLISTSVARWLERSYLGDVLRQMSSTFATAQEHQPCILFIDEIDNIGKRGSGGQNEDYWNSLVNRMLELLDGAVKTEGVVVVAATNRPEDIDPAILRSGRLERHISIALPDTDALIGIFRHHLGRDLDHVLATAPDLVAPGGGRSRTLDLGRHKLAPDRDRSSSSITDAGGDHDSQEGTPHA